MNYYYQNREDSSGQLPRKSGVKTRDPVLVKTLLLNAVLIIVVAILIVGVSSLSHYPNMANREKIASLSIQRDYSPLKYSHQSVRDLKNIYFSVGGEQYIMNPVTYSWYTVGSGDSLWNIAKKYEISVDSIYSCNLERIPNPHMLKNGTKLLIPSNIGIQKSVNSVDDIAKLIDQFQIDELSLYLANNVSSMNQLKDLKTIFLPNVELPMTEKLKAYGLAFGMPTRGYLTAGFGYRHDPFNGADEFHTGIDLGNYYGAPVYAAFDGTVILAGYNGGYGNCVMISHPLGYTTLYGHMSRLVVTVGKYVTKGTIIGYIGSTGMSTGPHLHFEIRKFGKFLNPLMYLGKQTTP